MHNWVYLPHGDLGL